MSNASMGEWGSHATTSSTIHVPHEVFIALHPTNERRRNRKHCLSNWNLHHWSNLKEDRHNHNTSKDTTCRTININHRKIKEEGGRKENNNAFKFGLIFSFSFSLFSAFVQVYICVAFSVFIYFKHV
jgi:hypothetical protein